MEPTHYLIVDREDDQVLAWFPKAEDGAQTAARAMAADTGHDLREGRYVRPEESGLTRAIWVWQKGEAN